MYQSATPAKRLDILDHKVSTLVDGEDIFSEETFRQVVKRLIKEMNECDIEHVDLRIGLVTSRWKWMRNVSDGLRVFVEELSNSSNLSISFLAAVNLAKSQDKLDSIFDTLLKDGDVASRIVGVDINFLPRDLHKLNRYLGTLRAFQENCFKINVHLGELFDNETSRYVLSRIIPNRIGHGVLLLQDQKLIDIIKHHNTCLDMCPTSNTLLGVFDWNTSSPASRALELGIPATINTDDPLMFATNLEREIDLARLTPDQLDAVRLNSREYSYAVGS